MNLICLFLYAWSNSFTASAGSASVTMFVFRRANLALPVRYTRPHHLTPRVAYSTDQGKVQTPLQSQRKDKIASPGYAPTESNESVQTPVQSQSRASIESNPPLTIFDAWPLYTLVGGLLAGSVFVYFYYQHRKAHMEKKWAAMLKEAADTRKSVGG